MIARIINAMWITLLMLAIFCWGMWCGMTMQQTSDREQATKDRLRCEQMVERN